MLALAVAAAWLMLGAVSVLVMRRRGHDTFAWAVVFVVLGPLAVPVAVSAERHRVPLPESPHRGGRLDVLAAHDGSPAASAALHAAVHLFGPQMTCLTLAAVVDIEAATTVRGPRHRT